MAEVNIHEGEVAVVAVYLDEPEDGTPTGEAIDLSFFLNHEGGIIPIDHVVEEPYIINWMDWKTMRLTDTLDRRLIYEDEHGMSCDIEMDILPVDPPEVVYAGLGSVMQTGFGES